MIVVLTNAKNHLAEARCKLHAAPYGSSGQDSVACNLSSYLAHLLLIFHYVSKYKDLLKKVGSEYNDAHLSHLIFLRLPTYPVIGNN